MEIMKMFIQGKFAREKENKKFMSSASYTVSREHIVRGEIYYIIPREEAGNYYGLNAGGRPAIIISNDMINEMNDEVVIVYLSRCEGFTRHLPTDVKISSSREPSYALCHKLFTIKKEKLGKFINQCTEEEMAEIEKALTIALTPTVDKVTTKEAVATYKKWQDFVQKKMEANETIKEIDEVKKENDVEATVEIKEVSEPIIDIKAMPEYIKLEAERDVYKQLYMDLLKEK